MKKKKKGFYTNLCRFEIFSMKIVNAIEPELQETVLSKSNE